LSIMFKARTYQVQGLLFGDVRRVLSEAEELGESLLGQLLVLVVDVGEC